MTGKITIMQLREKARKALGAKFDIGRFNDAILLVAALLEARIERYIAAAG